VKGKKAEEGANGTQLKKEGELRLLASWWAHGRKTFDANVITQSKKRGTSAKSQETELGIQKKGEDFALHSSGPAGYRDPCPLIVECALRTRKQPLRHNNAQP